jgi:asparagine synthetase B (glutamine-hydrolysing)
MQHRGDLVWSGNLKGFLALPDVVPQVDQGSVEDFLGMRYLMGDRTWFVGIECLSAATVLTWDARRGNLNRDRYWHWDEIEPLPATSDLREVAREAGQRLIHGMRQQTQPPGRPMLTFSAGLDSRALFAAAIHSQQPPSQTLTFEKPGDQEAAIPRQLSRQQGIPHQTIPVNPAQWIIPQALATWDLEAVVPLNQLIFYPPLPPPGDRAANTFTPGCCWKPFRSTIATCRPTYNRSPDRSDCGPRSIAS